jgi:RNA recognition motif-containing protein
MKTLFVGNLPFSTTEQELRDLFSQYGSVDNVQIVTARDSGLPRGFAFVTVDDDSAAAVVEALNGTMFAGRRIKVDVTREDQISPADKEAAEAAEEAVEEAEEAAEEAAEEL